MTENPTGDADSPADTSVPGAAESTPDAAARAGDQARLSTVQESIDDAKSAVADLHDQDVLGDTGASGDDEGDDEGDDDDTGTERPAATTDDPEQIDEPGPNPL